MAPTYRPLPAQIQGIPKELFTAAPLDFNDALRAELSLKAQQLANTNSGIATQRNQRNFDQEAQLVQALKEQFGGGTDFNPDEALKTAQRIAIGSGDLDTALDVDKRIRDRRVTLQPYDDSTRTILSQEMGVELPEGATPNLVDTLARIRRGNTYQQSIEDTRANRERTADANLPEGYEGNMSSADAKTFKTTLGSVKKMAGDLDLLEESVGRTGSTQMTDADFVLQRQLIGSLAAELKGPNYLNLGAAMSNQEYELLTTQLPKLLAAPGVSFGDVAVELGLGRDPMDAIQYLRDKLQRIVQAEESIRGGSHGLKRKAGFDPLARQPAGGAAPGNAPAGSSGPPPGLDKERFMQWYHSRGN